MGDLKDYMTTDQVLDHIQQVTGWSRRRARRDLMRKNRSGELPVMEVATDVPPTADERAVFAAKRERRNG